MPKLPSHIGLAYRRRLLPVFATLAALLVVEGLTIILFKHFSHNDQQDAFVMPAETLPVVLSQDDAGLYRKAFALEKAGKPDEADAALMQAADPLLRGVLLGERYLARYDDKAPAFCEIALWLARYGDHAQAGELYRIVQERTPDDAGFVTEPRFMETFKDFTHGRDRSLLPGNARWIAGLQAFRKHDAEGAFAQFTALLKTGTLPADDRAAVAFWAYRAADGAGKAPDAAKYLDMAANEAPGFYSILARQIANELHGQKTRTEAEDAASFLSRDAVRRAIALKEIGQEALAEKEMRALFLASGREDRSRVMHLAQMLDMPGARMRLAVAGNYDTDTTHAYYPLPRWKPALGYHLEPALIFAIIRQESGFDPNARNASGAAGVMQLMPSTALAMAHDAQLPLSSEPSVSMALGQHYLEYLMDMGAINDNLVYVLAAYNAGPGSVIAWQKSERMSDDPLLFVESIPNSQTRDYVVHVMGNYWVYSEILGKYDNTTVAALARNNWPRYERSGRQVALLRRDSNGAE